MKAFMFPGQGSQSKGMGGALFDEFEELTEKADKILGYSIKELCLEDPNKELSKTQFTQPALYVVNALSYFKKIKESGKEPDFVIGHSLGEFNALLAANCFDFEAGLKLVKKRGELMSQATDGGMAAILKGSKEEIESLLKTNGLKNIDLANFNSPSQIVISGLKDEIAKSQSIFQKGKMLYFPLNTSGAFHSRFMKPSQNKFEKYLSKFKLSDLKISVISNVTAEPYKNDEIVKNLSSQISSAVLWCESIQYLIAIGEKSGISMEFEEIGHGDVLTKLLAKIKEESSKPLTKNEQNKKISNNLSEKSTSVKKSSKSKDKIDNRADKNKSVLNDEKIKNSEIKKNSLFEKAISADEKVAVWNERYPVGTKTKSLVASYDALETRTEAVVLFGHRAAVYMKGYNGYFDLDEIAPL